MTPVADVALMVGLTGGIGSGKSTVARRLTELGAVLVDADAIAREVVAGGSEGLARILDEFGREFAGPDGELDRPRMAAAVFTDPGAREKLNGIVHPLVRARSAELVAAAPAGSIVVQDVPLLVEGGMGAGFALVVVVHADEEVRVGRLVGSRGMAEDDARARIRAQASDEQRRAAADVLLDNSGTPDRLRAQVDELWERRLVPFRDNMTAATPAPPDVPDPPDVPGQSDVPARSDVPDAGAAAHAAAAARLVARVGAAAGARSRGVEHVGPGAVPGLRPPGLIDLVLVVDDPAADPAADPGPALARIGFVPDGAARWGSADPARPARLRAFAADDPALRAELLVRDRLRAEPHDADVSWQPPDGWSREAVEVAERWAVSTGWVLPLR
ncbi:dephospho-CoA kinase [Pseudonocardia sulfidoxydans NBRC 16205]|uniref:Dephospho-CoA kinase n=1 Tax=Pseudonocardia sulfidoxydans NBRC 16205 TaxID=1223511 RepID=A0A511DKD8_9PSEU|nr:dephospho-CoA kinase [Pseudonocardia sulfidoxydans NBRC 16205]